jgi:hypothetical protein
MVERRLDVDAIVARATPVAREEPHAASNLEAHRMGAVFATGGTRTAPGFSSSKEHPYLVVIQATLLTRAHEPLTVVVVPCGPCARDEERAAYNLVCTDEDAFEKQETIAFASLVQVVYRNELVEYVGQLSAEATGRLLAIVIKNLGVVPRGAKGTT